MYKIWAVKRRYPGWGAEGALAQGAALAHKHSPTDVWSHTELQDASSQPITSLLSLAASSMTPFKLRTRRPYLAHSIVWAVQHAFLTWLYLAGLSLSAALGHVHNRSGLTRLAVAVPVWPMRRAQNFRLTNQRPAPRTATASRVKPDLVWTWP